MSDVKNCLSLCCSSVCFHFDSERLQRKWLLPGKKTNGGKSCTGTPNLGSVIIGQVIVPYFGHYFCFTILRVHSIGVIKISWVWGQVFSGEILQQSRRPKMMFN
jgi:hypothetical protein